ncbi:molybdenum cofactor guanylyltransferase MobA [Mesorhizobium sp. SB112]|uniref:molybdenum cofactor guanylyltransferase MobA n=1 Tax=Mesorhizobium sp. SB112 TaxID=3151853 RepID=UPI0032657D35
MKQGIAGIVLSGGLSSRMGGGDKGLLQLAGRSMLSRVLARLLPQVDTIAISANSHPALFSSFDFPVIPDLCEQPAAPLAGILACMEWAARTGSGNRIASVAVDTPFFPKDLVAVLSQELTGSERKIAVASSRGRLHPVFALWDIDLRHDLKTFMNEGKSLSVMAFIKRHGMVECSFPDLGLAGETMDPFFNVNTPDDLATAERYAKALEQ